MKRYLCISVRLFDWMFHGCRGGSVPEWPPSPMRLFQALVHGAFLGRASPDKDAVEALQWLEKLGPPIIIAPPSERAVPVRLMVPNNNSDEVLDRQNRLTEKVMRAVKLLEEGPIHYLWAVDENSLTTERPKVDTLGRIAHRLVALGWGIDLACAHLSVVPEIEVIGLAGQRWNPWPNRIIGGSTLRVPKEGTLNDLFKVYQSFKERIKVREMKGPRSKRVERYYFSPPLKPRVFDEVVYLPSDSLPPRHVAIFRIESVDPEAPRLAFLQAHIAKVASMVRGVACKVAQTDNYWRDKGIDPAEYVAGHSSQAKEPIKRFSYLPLPSVGHQYSDGMIRRVMIAEHYGGVGTHALWAMTRLNGEKLYEEGAGEPCAILFAMVGSQSDGVVRAYRELGDEWGTITPVILPGHDDNKRPKAEKLFLKAVAQAGIDPTIVTDIMLQKAPFWRNSLHVRDYIVPKHLAHLPRWHVRIKFKKGVPGPLAIGAGRHYGLGLFINCACVGS